MSKALCASCGSEMKPVSGNSFHPLLTDETVSWKCSKCTQMTYKGDTWKSLGLERPNAQ